MHGQNEKEHYVQQLERNASAPNILAYQQHQKHTPTKLPPLGKYITQQEMLNPVARENLRRVLES